MSNATDLEERIEKCRRVLSSDPNSRIFAALAEAHRKKGEFERAFQVCKDGLKIHPGYGSAHVVMAKVNLDRGQFDWAEAEAKKAAELDGNTRAIELLLAEIYIYQGEYSSAVRLLMKLKESDPGSRQIDKLLGIARQLPSEQQPAMEEHEGRTKSTETREQPASGAGQTADIQPLTAADLVAAAVRISGISGALFANHEGLIVDSEWSIELDSDLCGAALSDIAHHLEDELDRTPFGCPYRITVESQKAIFDLVRTANGFFLFAADGDANLGSMRVGIETLLARYRQ